MIKHISYIIARQQRAWWYALSIFAPFLKLCAMKKYMITMATAIIAVLQGCTFSENETQNESSGSKYYNICLVIDGTDRLSEQN
jgi:hypothetical protein